MNIIKTLKSSISEKGNYCYSLPVETTKEIIKDVKQLQQENQELKKQLEEYKHKGLYNTCLPYSTGYKKAIKEKENQQKEFIEYLEKMWKETQDIWYIKILQKYKEIIGGNDV